MPKDNSPGATLQYTQEMTTRQERATPQATTSSENSTQTPLCEMSTQTVTAPLEIPSS